MIYRPVRFIPLIAALCILFSVQVHCEVDNLHTELEQDASKKEALEKEALQIAKRFGGTLKPQLKQALQSGGTAHAIEVCSVQAPAIAAELSRETGWQVKRVSLKARNQQNASPDDWEEKVLQQFDAQQQAGDTPETLIHSEIVDNQFRFMKAQAVEPVCLNCHGESLSPVTQSALQQHYPDDTATGYSLGQIRGAFSLTKVL